MTPEMIAKQIAGDIAAAVSKTLREIRTSLDTRMAEVETSVQNQLAALPAPEKGEKGDKGEDAQLDMNVVDALITDAINEAVSKLELPKGEKGDKGEDAAVDMNALKLLISEEVSKINIPQPEKGEKGDAGQVDYDEVAKIVKAAVDKIELPKVKAQLDLEVEDGIDEERVYARGTMARHRGGLWRAFERTKGMRGWECIVAGIASISIDFDGERKLAITIERTDGEPEVKEFRIPAMIDKGVYREGEYQRGDHVTFSGAIWSALKDGVLGRPGTSPDWRLACKRGGTGKSAYDLARDAGFTGTRQEWLDQIGKKPIVKLPPDGEK